MNHRCIPSIKILHTLWMSHLVDATTCFILVEWQQSPDLVL